MVVGAYQLDLYCENTEVKHPHKCFPHTFVGETYGECVREARSEGWFVSRDRQRAICPLCNSAPAGRRR